ncbi:uncharacterized protein LOC141649189 [Silene latifolia]|uniref:uncharacterized protein LOC141649189 n=1 Tax=Silene latifolia TaxID=37657 RepID=UPI003D77BEEA
MKIASWNIRGFNCPIKQQEVRSFLLVNQIDILCLLETRVKSAKAPPIVQDLFGNWNVICNYGQHYNGRIWLFYNPSTISISSQIITSQMICCKAHHYGTNIDFCISMVYGFNNAVARNELWNSLTSYCPFEPWLVMGDFNIVRCPEEKMRPTPPAIHEMTEFNDCLASCHLDDMTSTGAGLTWTNKQDTITTIWT